MALLAVWLAARRRGEAAVSRGLADCEGMGRADGGKLTASLLERALHGRVELRPETLHDRDDRDRDTGGNQSVLDGGCARLIFCKTFQEICHRRLRRSTLACLRAVRGAVIARHSRTRRTLASPTLRVS